MKKKVCPPGQICVGSTVLITILIFVILILVFFIMKTVIPNNKFNTMEQSLPKKKRKCIKNIDTNINDTNINDTNINDTNINDTNINDTNRKERIVINYQPNSNSSYLVNKDHERVINPLLPPERRNHYIDPNSHIMVSPGVPINIPTRGESGGFQQIGVLHKVDSTDSNMKVGQNTEPVILPLMGAPTYNGSNKWSYYTATDKYNQIKLPLSNNNRQCDSEYGCDELYDDDIITVPAYNGSFKVKIYQFDKPKYLPFV